MAIEDGSITVEEQTRGTIDLSTNAGTTYADVVPSSLDAIKHGTLIGSAAKGQLGHVAALEIVLVPACMRASRVGPYPWDALPDTSGIDPQGVTPTTITNRTVRTSGVRCVGHALVVDLVGGKTVASTDRRVPSVVCPLPSNKESGSGERPSHRSSAAYATTGGHRGMEAAAKLL